MGDPPYDDADIFSIVPQKGENDNRKSLKFLCTASHFGKNDI
jgi:hypothetical protein